MSNAVPVFKEPASRSAQRTLGLIVGILMILLAGIALLCRAYGITATRPGEVGYQSVLSQLIAAVVGRGPIYYATIASVVAVLALSANTSFAGFPRGCGVLADDRFLPEPFLHRGRRLAFSHGVIVLALIAAVLLVIFEGITELIPLFAVGALSAFTLPPAPPWASFWSRNSRRGSRATPGPKLVILRSEFRQFLRPLLGFIQEIAEKEPSRQIAVVIPELVERRFYDRLLHDRTTALMKALSRLQGGPDVVMITTPWHLRDSR